MGNQEVKSAMRKIQNKDFNIAELEPFEQKLWTATEASELAPFRDLLSTDGVKVEDLAVATSRLDLEQSALEEDSERNNDQAQQLQEAGFATSERKREQLKQGDYKQIVIPNNEDAIEFESLMQTKVQVLTALFYGRNQGGSETLDDFFTFARKYMLSKGANFTFKASLDATLLATPESACGLARSDPAHLYSELKQLMDASEGLAPESLFSVAANGFAEDLKQSRLRKVLIALIESQATDQKLRALCVRLMMRLGSVIGSAEDLLRAAVYQSKYQIDITSQLEFYCKQSEKPLFFGGSVSGSYDQTDADTIQSRVAFTNGSDRCHEHDSFCTDGAKWYIYCDERGLARGNKRAENGEWSCENQSDRTDYQDFTMFCHQDKLLVRHRDNPDAAFVVFDKETLLPAENEEPYVTAEDSALSLKWTPTDQAYGDNGATGNRWVRYQPFFSDGELIYTIVRYRRGNSESEVVRTVLEIYEVEDRKLTLCQEVPLMKDDRASPFIGSRHKDNYLRKGSLACNGQVLLWHSNHYMHIFDVGTGVRIKKTHLNSTALVSCYDAKDNYYYHMDAACYSWLKRWKIEGFKPRQIAKKAKKLPDLPIVLDSLKGEILAQINDQKKQKEEAEKAAEEAIKKDEQVLADLFDQLASKASSASEEETKIQSPVSSEESKTTQAQIEKRSANTMSIILSKMGTEAQVALYRLSVQGEKSLVGEEMLPFFKRKFSVMCSRDFIVLLREALSSALAKLNQGGKVKVLDQRDALNLMLLYQANIDSLIACRIELKKIFEQDELVQIAKLQDLLDTVELFEGQSDKKIQELSEEELFQLHLNSAAIEINKVISINLDVDSRQQKLASIETCFTESSEGQAPLSVQLRRQLSSMMTKRGMKDLFEGSKTDLDHSRRVLKLALSSVKQQVSKRVKQAVDTQNYSLKLDQGFLLTIMQFVKTYCTELMVNFGNQLLIILDNSGAKKDGDLSSEKKVKLEVLQKAEGRKQLLEEAVYETFILISEVFKEQMIEITSLIKAQVSKPFDNNEQAKDFYDFFKKLFRGENSVAFIAMQFSLMVCTHKAEVLWLDEVAEALRNCAEGLDAYILMTLGAQPVKADTQADTFRPIVDQALRQVCFAIGVVSYRLIQLNSDESASSKNLSKLNILQGGVEARFIPSLKPETKEQIEGSFKITNDRVLRQLALKQSSDVILEASDSLLMGIIDKEKSQDKVENVIQMLQKALSIKQPMCPFANLGGRFGMFLTRAAFAVLLKFSDGLQAFYQLLEDVDRAFTERAASDDSTDEKLKSIIAAFKEQDHSEFASLLKQWEQAAQMRKWTSSAKLRLSEKTKVEAERAIVEEINAANPSAEPFSGDFDKEQKRQVEQRANQLFDKQIEKTYESAIQKAKFLIKLAIPKALLKLKSKEKMQSFKQGIMGKLNSQVLSLQKDKSQVGGLPSTGRRQSLMSGVSRSNSLRSNDGTQMVIRSGSTLERKKTLLVRGSQLNEREKEFDWRDRLRQWKQVAQSAGAVNSFADQQVQAFQSSTFSVLGILQADVTCKELEERVETSLINGLRRSAGLHLLNFAFNLSYEKTRFFDLVQWLQGSLRNNLVQVPHYLSGLEGSGNKAETGIQEQFVQIIECLIDALKNQKLDQDDCVHLVNALCWNYNSEDHQLMDRLGIFQTLLSGNGHLLHQLRRVWGTEETNFALEKNKKNKFSLASRTRQAFEFLIKNVLEGIFVEQKQEKIELGSETSSQSLIAKVSASDGDATAQILKTICSALFGNLSRYVYSSSGKPQAGASDPLSESHFFTCDASESQESLEENFPMDIATYINEQGGSWDKVKLNHAVDEFKKDQKVAMLISKIDQVGSVEEDSDLAKLLRDVAKSTVKGNPSLAEAVTVVRDRKFRVCSQIKSLSWAELGLEEPEVSLEAKASLMEWELSKVKEVLGVIEQEQEEESKGEVSAFDAENQPEGQADDQQTKGGPDEEAKQADQSQATSSEETVEITLLCSNQHKMRMLWESSDREHSGSNLWCPGEGINCDLCRKSINTKANEPSFRCAWADCDYDVCRDCGVQNGGIETPRPPQTLKCSANHYMWMHFGPYASKSGGGHILNCDLCRKRISNLSDGFFRCNSRNCDYDVCQDCGLRNGGIAVPKPTNTELVCCSGHFMNMLFAPEPRCIRGRNLYCDLCRARIPLDSGYFRCGTNCNYDVCHDCGMSRGGIDPDKELYKYSKKARELLKKKALELKESLKAKKAAIEAETDENKKLALKLEILELMARFEAQNAGMRQIVEQDDTKVQGQPYSEVSLTRFVNLLDLLIGLAGDTPEGFEVIKAFSDPSNLSVLLHVSVTASVRTQITIQKLLQQMLALDLPQQTFEEAVALAKELNNGDNKVAQILASQSCLQFEGSSFLQLLFNQVQVTRQAIYSQDKLKVGAGSVAQEILRTIRIITANSNANEDLRKAIRNALDTAMLSVMDLRSLEPVDADSLFSTFAEGAFKSLSIGAPVLGNDGKIVSALGFIGRHLGDNQLVETVSTMLSKSNNRLVSLYLDPMNPARQNVISLQINQAEPLLDFDETQAETGAKGSVFMEAQPLELFMDVLLNKSAVSLGPTEQTTDKQRHVALLLRAFIMRGLYTTFDVLKEDFLENLSQFDMLAPLFKHLMEQPIPQSNDASMNGLTPTLLELQADFLRNRLVSDSTVDAIAKSKERSVQFFHSSDAQAIWMVLMEDELEEKPDQDAILFGFRIVRKLGQKLGETRSGKATRARIPKSEMDLCCFTPTVLYNLSEDLVQVMEQAKVIVTSDDIDFDRFFDSLKPILAKKNKEETFKAFFESLSYYTVSVADFEIVSRLLDSASVKPLSQEYNPSNILALKVLERLGLTEGLQFSSESVVSLFRGVFVGQTEREVEAELRRRAAEEVQSNETTKEKMQQDFAKLLNTAESESATEATTVAATEESKSESEPSAEKTEASGDAAQAEPAQTESTQAEQEEASKTEQSQPVEEEKKEESKDLSLVDSFLLRPLFDQIKDSYYAVREAPSRRSDQNETMMATVFSLNDQPLAEAYRTNLEQLASSYSRELLFGIVAEATEHLEPELVDSLKAEGSFQKLCDLVHAQLSFATWLSETCDSKQLLEQTQGKAKALLTFMKTAPGFTDFFVSDMVKRAKNLFGKEFEGVSERCLKSANLLFLGPLIVELGFYKAGEKHKLSQTLFEVNIAYALIYNTQADYIACHSHIKEALAALAILHEESESFAKEPALVQDFFACKLMEPLSQGLDCSRDTLSDRQKLSLELVARIVKLQKKLAQHGLEVELNFELHESLRQTLKMQEIIEQGNAFTSMMAKIKLKAILSSPIDLQKLSHIFQSYATVKQKFNTGFKRNFEATDDDLRIQIEKISSSDLIKITSSNNDKSVLADINSLKTGKKVAIRIPKGTKATIEFPVYPQVLQRAGSLEMLGTASLEQTDEWQKMEETTQCAAVQVHALHRALILVGGDESIWGMGFRAQGSKEELRRIETPEGCSDFKKVVHGKFFRVILTRSGRLWFNGQNRKYMFSSRMNRHEHLDHFHEIKNNFYRLEGNDKMVDLTAGKHFTAVATEKGKIYASGYIFWRYFSAQCRYNAERDEDYPFELKLPEGYKALKIFGAEKYSTLFVTAQDEEGKKVTFSAGQEEDIQGQNSSRRVDSFKKLALPEDTYLEQVVCHGYQAFGIDQKGSLWQWGRHYDGRDNEAANVIYYHGVPERRSQPRRWKWFRELEIKVLDVRCGGSDQQFAVVKTQDKDGKLEFYGLSPDTNQQRNMYGGESTTQVYKQIVSKINVNANQVASFACTTKGTYFLMSKKEESQSMDPANPQSQGLLHFYQEDHPEKEIEGKLAKVWKFLTAAEYEAKKAELPDVCFATRHTIKELADAVKRIHDNTATDSDWQYAGLPDLGTLAADLAFDSEAESHTQKTTVGNKTVPSTEPLYYSYSTVEGNQQVFATESEAIEGGQSWDLNPVVYYRLKKPVSDLQKLPQIDADALFEKQEGEDSQIKFTVRKDQVTAKEIAALEISDTNTTALLAQVKSFTPDQDAQILAAIDKQMLEKHGGKSITDMTVRNFEFAKDHFSKASSLQSIEQQAIELRAELLVKFNKVYSSMIRYISVAERNTLGTLSHRHYSNRLLALSSVINTMIDLQLDQIKEGPKPEINVNRRKAMAYQEEGKVDHEGKYSLYGQILQAMKGQIGDGYMRAFRKKNTDGRIYRINFKGEGSIDAGGPFRDSIVNVVQEMESGVVPLLIKSPNNRNDHGANRDCFILDPASTSPAHIQMFRFLGAFIGFGVLSKSPVPLNLAPTVWKQLLGEQLNLADLESIDAYSTQVLTDLRQYSNMLSEEEFVATVDQNFTTVLSNGTEVVLCEGGEDKMVSKDSIDEFVALVLKARSNEANEQVAAIREGLDVVFDGKFELLSYLTPTAMEIRACGEKVISTERLRSITTFPNCDSSHEIVGRFWRVFEEWTPSERAAYLKFVWGRNRLPIDLSGCRNHEVRLMTNLNDNGFPLAHTCFFQLDIPYYRDDDTARRRLTQASELCGGIDTDNNNFAEE